MKNIVYSDTNNPTSYMLVKNAKYYSIKSNGVVWRILRYNYVTVNNQIHSVHKVHTAIPGNVKSLCFGAKGPRFPSDPTGFCLIPRNYTKCYETSSIGLWVKRMKKNEPIVTSQQTKRYLLRGEYVAWSLIHRRMKTCENVVQPLASWANMLQHAVSMPRSNKQKHS